MDSSGHKSQFYLLFISSPFPQNFIPGKCENIRAKPITILKRILRAIEKIFSRHERSTSQSRVQKTHKTKKDPCFKNSALQSYPKSNNSLNQITLYQKVFFKK